MAWIFNPNDYEEKDFAPIPAGEHRVRIEDVAFKTFKSGNNGYEITLEVSGFGSKLWHYLVLKQDDPKKTNQSIGSFFDSFGINNYSLGTGKQWIGSVGAVRVKHGEYNGNPRAEVAYFIARSRQDKLEPWKGTQGAVAAAPVAQVEIPEDLPFD